MIKFYCTDWAPNGTSDLLIFDGETQVDQIDEALFEPDLEDGRLVEDGGMLYPLNKGQILRFVATSPFDPKGQEIYNKLEPYFVIGSKVK